VQRQRLAQARTSATTVIIRGKSEIGDAASRPRAVGGALTWRFTADSVRDFAWAAARHFIWDAVGADSGRVLAQSFYPPSADSIWNRSSEYVKHAVEFYGARWLRYPYPTMSNINGIEGGMEYPMIVFCRNRTSPTGLFSVTDHEVGHSWWPMIVGNNERLYPWMDEGFNTFIDWFSFRDRYPTDTVRIQSLEFGAMSAWQKFLATRAPESPIMEAHDRGNSAASGGWNAYGKPAVGLHFLREQVLDSTVFDAAFAEYTRRWAFRHPTPADFFRSINDGVGEDLSWFWRSWFLRTDHLDQAVDSVRTASRNGQAVVSVFLSSKREMVAPVELRLTTADGATRTVKLPVETWLRGNTTVWRTLSAVNASPVKVEIDPRGVYPDVDRGNNVWTAPR
jgi:hypothetical protein